MSIFNKREITIPKFETRSEAYSFALQHFVEEERMSLTEASEKANQFAETFAKNMGLPLKHVPPPTGMDKFMDNVSKITIYLEKNPKIVEYAVPALTFLVGLFTGNKTADHNCPPPDLPKPNKDFDINNLD